MWNMRLFEQTCTSSYKYDGISEQPVEMSTRWICWIPSFLSAAHGAVHSFIHQQSHRLSLKISLPNTMCVIGFELKKSETCIYFSIRLIFGIKFHLTAYFQPFNNRFIFDSYHFGLIFMNHFISFMITSVMLSFVWLFFFLHCSAGQRSIICTRQSNADGMTITWKFMMLFMWVLRCSLIIIYLENFKDLFDQQ